MQNIARNSRLENSSNLNRVKLSLSERLVTFALGVFTALGVILTLSQNKLLCNATKELFAQSWTGIVYNVQEKKITNVAECARMARELNSVLGNHSTKVTVADIESFLNRNGRLQIWKEEEIIPLSRHEKYIVGCTSGANRSQAHFGYLSENKIEVLAVLAGGDSGFNLDAEFPLVGPPYGGDNMGYNDRSAFMECFGIDKVDQLGVAELGEYQYDDLNQTKEFYKNYVNSLSPTHFITYGLSGSNTLRRLLERVTQSLEGFTLTFINWNDEIGQPVNGTEAYSIDAYMGMKEKISRYFPIVG